MKAYPVDAFQLAGRVHHPPVRFDRRVEDGGGEYEWNEGSDARDDGEGGVQDEGRVSNEVSQ